MSKYVCYEFYDKVTKLGHVYNTKELQEALDYWVAKLGVVEAIHRMTVRKMGTKETATLWDFYVDFYNDLVGLDC